MSGDQPSGVLRDRWLLWLIAIGLLLRVALAFALDGRLSLTGDELSYALYSAQWLATGSLETGNFVRPPLYFAVVAAIQSLGASLALPPALLLRLLQSVAGAALALPVYRTARRLAGVRSARLAAGIVMLDPTLVACTHLFWPETFYTLVVAIVFDAVAGLEGRPVRNQMGIGALIGVALLLKPVFGLFALLVAAFWLLRLPFARAARLLAVVGGVATLVIAPWVMRNVSLYGASILMENQGPYNLWVGNVDDPGPQVLRSWIDLDDPVERSRAGVRNGLAAIADDPAGFVTRSGGRALNLWGFEFFVVRHLTIGGYKGVTKTIFLWAFWVIQCAWFATLALVGAGLVCAWRDPSMRLLWIFAAVFTIVVSTMVGATRFRLPFALPIAVTAALGVQSLSMRAGRRSAFAGLAVAGLVIGGSVSKPSFRTIAAAQYDSPRELSNADWNFFRY